MAPQTSPQQQGDNAHVVMEWDGTRWIQLRLPLTSVDQDKLVVRPVDSTLVILHNEEVLKTVKLPESVDPFTVEAKLAEDGVLTVKALLMG